MNKLKKGLKFEKLMNNYIKLENQKSIDEVLKEEFLKAKQELDLTRINFNNATPKYVDVAIYNMNAAEEKIKMILIEMKEAGVKYNDIINL